MTVMSCIHVDQKAISAKGSRQLLCCLLCVVWKLELVMQNFFWGGKEAYLAYKPITYYWYSWNINSLLQGLVDYYRKRGIILQKSSLWTILLTSTFFQDILFFFWLCSHFHWSLASFLMLIMPVWGWLWCDYGLGGGYGDSQHPKPFTLENNIDTLHPKLLFVVVCM